MGLEQQDLDQIKSMITEAVTASTESLKEAMVTADKGLAASLKNEFKTKFSDIESKLTDTKGSESEGDDTGGNNSGKETPAMKALRQQIEALQAENEKAKQREKDNALRLIIEQSLAGQSVNADVKSDLIDKLFSEWKENLTEDNGAYFVKQGSDYKQLQDASKDFLASPRGAIYLQKPVTDGTGKKSQDKGVNTNGKGEETLESLLLQGVNEMLS